MCVYRCSDAQAMCSASAKDTKSLPVGYVHCTRLLQACICAFILGNNYVDGFYHCTVSSFYRKKSYGGFNRMVNGSH